MPPNDIAAPIQKKRYLLDEYALERCMAKGSVEEHAIIDSCSNEQILATSTVREDFCAAYPDDEPRIKARCGTAVQKREDNLVAAEYAERVENIADTDDPIIQDKLLLLAVARRLGATVVSGESVSLDTKLAHLSNDEVQCISVDDFLAELKSS